VEQTLMVIKLRQGPQIFQIRWSHLKILSARRVICSKGHSDDTETLGFIVQNLVACRRGARDLSTAALRSYSDIRYRKSSTCIIFMLREVSTSNSKQNYTPSTQVFIRPIIKINIHIIKSATCFDFSKT
jgi:hypothetical protein